MLLGLKLHSKYGKNKIVNVEMGSGYLNARISDEKSFLIIKRFLKKGRGKAEFDITGILTESGYIKIQKGKVFMHYCHYFFEKYEKKERLKEGQWKLGHANDDMDWTLFITSEKSSQRKKIQCL